MLSLCCEKMLHFFLPHWIQLISLGVIIGPLYYYGRDISY